MEDHGEVSLEELRQSYEKAASSHLPPASLAVQTSQPQHPNTSNGSGDEIQIFDESEEPTQQQDVTPISPIAIIEAVLLVGRPDGGAISATEIAALMRGVSEQEVDQLIIELNEEYQSQSSAMRVRLVGGAYKLDLADDLAYVRERFLGPARSIRLNQPAIDCLALVAYQPGVTRELLDQQRGQPSGAILNQLVRRELLEMRREKQGKSAQAKYYPTQRMLELVGLASLEDLPTVEELNG